MKFQLIYRKSTFFPNSWERKKTTLRLIWVTIYKCLQILSFDVRILASIFGYSVQLQNPKIVIPSLNGFVVRFCQPGGVDKKSYLCKSRDQSMAKRCCRKIGNFFRQLSLKIQLSFVLFFFYFSVQSLEETEFFPGFTYIFYLFHERLNTVVLKNRSHEQKEPWRAGFVHCNSQKSRSEWAESVY